MTDQETLAVAIKAAIAAAIAAEPLNVPVYDIDEVPGTPGGPGGTSGTLPPRYVANDVSRRWEEKQTAGGVVSVPGGALATHYRGPNVTDVRKLRRVVTARLEARSIDLPDGDTVTFEFEFEGDLTFVDAGWSGFDTWTFA